VLKAVAADSIDDCVTVDFSRQNLDKRRRASVSAKNPATSTLAATLARTKTDPKPTSFESLPPAIDGSPAPTPTHTHAPDAQLKFGLPTPVKRAIQSKRKSISFDLEKLQEIQTVPAEATTQAPPVPPPTNSETGYSSSAVETALNRVIQQHQKKLLEELRTVEESTHSADPSLSSVTPITTTSTTLQTPHNTTKPETGQYSALKTPLKRDIHSRRITRSAVKILETSDSPLINSVAPPLPLPPADLTAVMTPPPVRSSARKTRQNVSHEHAEVILQPSPAAEPVPVIERRVTRQSLKTPLKSAIQSRRKSLVTAVETLDKVLDDPIVEPERSTLKTPLKKAIEARRKSYAAQVEALDQLALNEEPMGGEDEELAPATTTAAASSSDLPSPSPLVLTSSDQPSPPKEIPRALRSPLKKAIEMRRKSLESEVAAIDKLGEPEQPTGSPQVAPRNIRLSLQRAIHSRRKSLSTEIDRLSGMEKKMEASGETAAETLAKELQLLPPPSLPAPLLAAIESRRYNLKSEVKILEEISFLAAQEEVEEPLDPMEAPVASPLPPSSGEERQILKTPIRKAIQSRRKSSSKKRVSLDQVSSGARALQTPLRKAIQSRRKSLLAEIGHLDDSFSCAAASIGADLSAGEGDLADMSLLKSPFAMAEMGVEYEANQLCSRLSIASFASSIGRFDVSSPPPPSPHSLTHSLIVSGPREW
jgi:hypothetical protein